MRRRISIFFFQPHQPVKNKQENVLATNKFLGDAMKKCLLKKIVCLNTADVFFYT